MKRKYFSCYVQLFSIISFLILLIFENKANSKTNSIHVYTIGNFADLNADALELKALHQLIEKEKSPAIILFSGDITKANLLNDIEREKDSIRINSIIHALQSKWIKHMIFLPGDRDWLSSNKYGLNNANIIEKILESLPFQNITWQPGHGCPGPKEVEIGDNLLLLIINTQYWNHLYRVPAPIEAECNISSLGEFMEELEDNISESRNKNVLISGHFPIISTGEYGGAMNFRKHIFPLTDVSPNLWIPLPVVGSLYPAYRQNVGSDMDIINERYQDFNEGLKQIIQDNPGLIYVSGHDYIQQLLYSNKSYFINSGALIKYSYSGRSADMVYSYKRQSLFRLEYENNGDVIITSFLVGDGKIQKHRSIDIFQSACFKHREGPPINEYYAPCKSNIIYPNTMSGNYEDSIIVTAGEEYKAKRIKRTFLGNHYRDSWTQPVKTTYLNLDTTFGGLIPIKRGGGRQTTSLKFRAGDGCEYVFRSVNKDPSKALPYDLRGTVVANVVKDQTSTQQPYGALSTKFMLDKLNILHPAPELYVLPPDDKLGPFKSDYGDMLGMLEESPKSPKNGCPGFGGSDEVLRSYKLFRNLYKNPDYQVDQLEFARAKVFDIFVGDWGRHEDNWKWAGYKLEQRTTYRPIPRDRDHVFSVWDGVLPWIADREWFKPSGEHFGYKIKDIRSLTWSARHLDRMILNQVGKEDWINQVEIVKEALDEDIIETSLKNLPPEIYTREGQEIEDKLKIRHGNLESFVLDYYKLLAQEVDVLGTTKMEKFEATRGDDGSVNVVIKNRSGKETYYDRTFFPEETKEIRLFGLGNEDIFIINGNSDNSIKIRVVGGAGKDSIADLSSVKGRAKHTLIYEQDPESCIIKGSETKIVNSWNDHIYEYDRQAFTYNTYSPIPYLGYNSDDGMILGLGVSFIRQKFGKEDYASKHKLKFKTATNGNLQFSFDGDIHHLVRKWDLLYYGLLAYPTDFVYFYGFGNESLKIDSLFDQGFYKTRYNSILLGTGLNRKFWKKCIFSLIFHYENNESQISENTILDLFPNVFGVGNVNLLEGKILLDLDFRNDIYFPERGMRLYSEFNQGLITSNNNSLYTNYIGFLEFHSTIESKIPLIIGLKGGGAWSTGEIPFYNLPNLGQNNYLRGYRKNRFIGESMIFFNSDLKIQVLDIATVFLPIKLGVRGFYDIGKVYISGESSSIFHSGYGGGIYIIPLESSFSLGLNMAFSEEEKNGLFIFELGIAF
jgi:hypothetical protein